MKISNSAMNASNTNTIFVYLKRQKIFINFGLWAGCCLCLGCTCIFILVVHLMIGGLLWPLILFNLTFILFVIAAWNDFLLPFHLQDPCIVINQEGIRIGKYISPVGTVFFQWKEIQRITIKRSCGDSYLCIYPQEISHDLRNFSRWKRLLIRTHSIEHALFCLPESYLNMPLQEILHQAYSKYCNEHSISSKIDLSSVSH